MKPPVHPIRSRKMYLENTARSMLVLIFSYLHAIDIERTSLTSTRLSRLLDPFNGAMDIWEASSPPTFESLVRRRVSLNTIIWLSDIYIIVWAHNAERNLIMLCNQKCDDIFLWVAGLCRIERVGTNLVKAALLGGNPAVADWALKHAIETPSRRSYARALIIAYYESNHKMIAFLENHIVVKPKDIWQSGPYHGNLDLRALEKACKAGNTSAAQQLVKKYQFIISKMGAPDAVGDAFRLACSRGHLGTVKWLTKKFKLGRIFYMKTPFSRALTFRQIVINCSWYTQLGLARWIIGRFKLSESEIQIGIKLGCEKYNKKRIEVFREISKIRGTNYQPLCGGAIRGQIKVLESEERKLISEMAEITLRLSKVKTERFDLERGEQ